MMHECGGTVLSGTDCGDGRPYVYCDQVDTGGEETIPDGTDIRANVEAWDAGEERSPRAEFAK